jgi:hypothetical protein
VEAPPGGPLVDGWRWPEKTRENHGKTWKKNLKIWDNMGTYCKNEAPCKKKKNKTSHQDQTNSMFDGKYEKMMNKHQWIWWVHQLSQPTG